MAAGVVLEQKFYGLINDEIYRNPTALFRIRKLIVASKWRFGVLLR